MPIVRRTYADVYRDGKKRLQDNTTLNNFNPQGIVKGYLDMVAIETDNLYNTADYIYKAIDPTRALGQDLDKLGGVVGESRTNSVVATDFTYTNFHFMIDPRLNWNVQKLIEQNYTPEERDVLETNGYISRTGEVINSLIIPQGLAISNTTGTITYTTSAQAILSGADFAYVPIVSLATGADSNVESNVLLSHTLNSIIELKKIAHFIKCTNTFPIQNGKYSLTDDEYRYNISIGKASIPTNEIAVRRAALSVPGVRDVLFERHKFGNGTMHLIIDGVSPIISNGLIQAVTERTSQAASYSDSVYISAPEYLGVEITFYIDVDSGITDDDFLRDAAKNSIIQYINDLPLGGEIIWNQIVSNVIAIEGIRDFYPSIFKYGKYDAFTKMNSKHTLLRFSNQKAKYNQKWYCDQALLICCS